MKFEWEPIGYNQFTARAKVFGGWIVNTWTRRDGGSVSESSVFIPDPNHEWSVE